MKLTKAQFIAQFESECNVDKIRDTLSPMKTEIYYDGVKIYRALNKIIIEVNGRFYCHT